jgi:MscS family membrane protein
LLVLWNRITNLGTPQNRVTRGLRRLLTPVAIILVVEYLQPFFDLEIIVAGEFAQFVNIIERLVIFVSAVWALWLVAITFFEWIILSPAIPDDSLDANLLRLSARVIGFIGGVVILAVGAQNLGLPVLSLVAGLGIGGLAVALAIRPTLENLIGGAILYADRPVRVGDFCSFGTRSGFVENIGVRSTQVRALDRTLISIPNATFADMEIVNWAKCDRMLILNTIGLRYETAPDQLRYVLARLREMFLAHPKIDHDTVRVRFFGYGDSSLDIEIRVYALTREFNEFYAIREDTFLRVNEIVNESGTGFAFPSRTVYMGSDEGLDKERSDAAVEEVQSWRRDRRLPFPRMSPRRAEEITGTLDYPPRGSPDTDASLGQATEEAPEPLSAQPEVEETKNEEHKTEPKRR